MEGSKFFRILFFVFIIIICGVIYYFSSQNGEKSGDTSGKVIIKLINIFPEGRRLSGHRKTQIVEKLQPIMRKIAHFSIYTLLGFNLMGFFLTFKLGNILKYLLPISFGIIYAISDEFHQMFSTGRSARIFDVGIDTFGVTFGILLIMLFSKIVYWARNSKEYKKIKEHQGINN